MIPARLLPFTFRLYRVVSFCDVGFLKLMDPEFFSKPWRALVQEEELVCAKTGVTFAPLPKPQAIVMDVSGTTYKSWLLL